MVGLIVRRVLQFVVVAWVLGTILFFALRVSGDPVTLLLGPEASEESIEAIQEKLGLNRPILVQYGDFLYGLLPKRSDGEWTVLDFGPSLSIPQPAMDLVLDRLPATLALGATGLGIAISLSVPLGVAAARLQGRALGSFIMTLGLMGQVVPSFLLALIFITLFGVTWSVLPVFGFGGPASLILPGFCLAAYPLARQVRLLRSQLLEVGAQDYIRTARSKGLPDSVVTRRHMLPNAILPWITLVGLDFGLLLSGSIIVETIFAWPGIGSQLIVAIDVRDYPVVQADIFIVGLLVVFCNLMADICYGWVNPRLRTG